MLITFSVIGYSLICQVPLKNRELKERREMINGGLLEGLRYIFGAKQPQTGAPRRFSAVIQSSVLGPLI